MPEAQEAFWHTQYTFEPYFVAGRGFDQYAPAYLLGWQAGREQGDSQQGSPSFESQENELRARWLQAHGSSLLDWAQVKAAVKAAFRRTVALQKLEEQLKPLGDTAKMGLALVLQAGQSFAEIFCAQRSPAWPMMRCAASHMTLTSWWPSWKAWLTVTLYKRR